MHPPTTSSDRYPLSFMQQSMVIASLGETRARPYVVQTICTLREEVDVAALREAWQRVTEAHPVLRSRIYMGVQEGFYQEVTPEAPLAWEEEDWSGQPCAEQERRLEDWLGADAARGFQIDAAPLSRLVLLRMARTEYRLIWTNHHAIIDGRSRLALLQEAFACYDALRGGRTCLFPSRPPFRDHIAWLLQQDWAAAEPFWRAHLRGITEPTCLVRQGRRKAGAQTPTGGKQRVSLSDASTRRLEAVARHHAVTTNTLVQGAWALLLSVYTGKEDVLFGAARACRHSSVPGAEAIVGLLINTVPVRVAVPPGASLGTWLQALHAQWMALRRYEHTPLDRIQAWSEMPPGTPLFESILIYNHEEAGSMLRAQGGAWLNRGFEGRQQIDGPITLTAWGRPSLTLQITYDRQRFDAETIERMLAHLHTLLVRFTDRPETRLADLSLLTEAERQQLLVAWNSTATDHPEGRCLHELFEEQASSRPAAVAAVIGHEHLSYGTLNGRANRLAWHLRGRGVGPETLVGVCLDRSPAAVVAFWAVLKAGGVFMPLDPNLPARRLVALLDDARPLLVLTQERHGERLEAWPGEVLRMEDLWEGLPLAPDHDLAPAATPANTAYAISTSGSTGRPKSVLVPHSAIVNHTLAARRRYAITAEDRRVQFGSISTDLFVAEVANYLTAGATLVLPPDGRTPSIAELLRFITTHGITVTGMPSSYWHEWVEVLDELTVPACLRLVITGMEKVRPDALERWQQRAGGRVRWCNAYGPTETTGTATIFEAAPGDAVDPAEVPIGTPLANVRVYVLDRHLNPLPVDVPGELCIAGDGLARGYLRRPALTAEKFVPDPFSKEGGRLYRTGDLGYYRPDGHLVFVGRLDRQVKVRGFRLELEEIEAVLMEHPGVRQAAVVAHGEGGETWLAGYVTTGGPALPEGSLRSYLAERLPDHMVPSVIVPLDAMPLTSSRKIDRRALPVPARREQAGRPSLEPQTPAEHYLAAVWAGLLGLEAVSADGNFFALGGNSLKAIQMTNEIRRGVGVDVSLRTIFEHPTLAGLAAAVFPDPLGSREPARAEGRE